ncbi:MAG: hypothetical protein ACKO28_11915, partial [Cyanobium sp.]
MGHPRLGSWLVPLLLLSQLTAPLKAAQAQEVKSGPQTQPSTQAPAADDGADLDAYILGSGDRLEITFLSTTYEKLGGTFELLNDGSTSLPMIGSV